MGVSELEGEEVKREDDDVNPVDRGDGDVAAAEGGMTPATRIGLAGSRSLVLEVRMGSNHLGSQLAENE